MDHNMLRPILRSPMLGNYRIAGSFSGLGAALRGDFTQEHS